MKNTILTQVLTQSARARRELFSEDLVCLWVKGQCIMKPVKRL